MFPDGGPSGFFFFVRVLSRQGCFDAVGPSVPMETAGHKRPDKNDKESSRKNRKGIGHPVGESGGQPDQETGNGEPSGTDPDAGIPRPESDRDGIPGQKRKSPPKTGKDVFQCGPETLAPSNVAISW